MAFAGGAVPVVCSDNQRLPLVTIDCIGFGAVAATDSASSSVMGDANTTSDSSPSLMRIGRLLPSPKYGNG